MAPPARPQKPAKSAWTVLFYILLGASPVVIVMALAWFDFDTLSPGEVPKPVWVSPGTICATTTDGVPVKTKVAINAADTSAKLLMERQLNQVGLVLQNSLASKSRQQLTGPQGISGLSEDMLTQLNGYLGQQDIAPAKAVVVQDFLMGSP
ncbi:MAG: flagellar basal body-associated FliL family protein [Rhizobacter sp.]